MFLSTPPEGIVVGNKYRIVRALGRGGMGAVYEAENLRTGRHVALKWTRPDMLTQPDAQARIVREAQAIARVRHPNVVDIYDVESEGDALFIVMELLHGESLTTALKRGGMQLHQLIALLLPAMHGVAAAHRADIIHRDIKPDNIFLARIEAHDGAREGADVTFEGIVPKVMDFGVSKLRDLDALSLTAEGVAIGTPIYMSYEQLRGDKDIDARTDIYAFGVILYLAITGKLPFEAVTVPELALKLATCEPLHPNRLRADVPLPLADLVLRALAKERSERVQSMPELIAGLEPYANAASFRELMNAPGESPSVPEPTGSCGQHGTRQATRMIPTAAEAFDPDQGVLGGATRFSEGRKSQPSARTRSPVRPRRSSKARVLLSSALLLATALGGYLLWSSRSDRPLPSAAPASVDATASEDTASTASAGTSASVLPTPEPEPLPVTTPDALPPARAPRRKRPKPVDPSVLHVQPDVSSAAAAAEAPAGASPERPVATQPGQPAGFRLRPPTPDEFRPN